MPKKSTKLPPLAFGNLGAKVFDDFGNYADFAAREFQLAAIEDLSARNEFKGKLCFLEVGSVTAAAYSTTNLLYADEQPKTCYLDIKFEGKLEAQTSGSSIIYQAGQAAFFPPEEKITGKLTNNSSVVFKLDLDRLFSTAWQMYGSEVALPRPEAAKILKNPLLFSIISYWSQLFDECGLDQKLIARLNPDDQIYRATAMALFSDILVRAAPEDQISQSRSGRALRLICEKIKQDHSRWISKSEMEALTGVTGRSIQIAFQRKYGITPMEWQKRGKLHFARQQILKGAIRKISTLAEDLAFPSASRFSGAYKTMFGELPSETLKRTK